MRSTTARRLAVPVRSTALGDHDLIARIKDDSIEAFRELCARHHAEVTRAASAACRDEVVSARAVRDTFLWVWADRANTLPPVHGTVTDGLTAAARMRAADLRLAARWAVIG